ncbi:MULTISPECIES: tyrosine-protein kinase [unclassified Kaistella]|uniref:GumC family protein n=1 Tax=unclassified Kaistella TaxID=2762626 RepID=UPI00273298B7|nr:MULTISPECIES: tyrosine-protein kinase [unclassified Kaistella]MDP2452536.1 polysaccharide biosynthesis tyrosine autokinase [Kaistella sp. SH11-4b]MDP2455444.1 polysaccharide biosynthesis tyrosine autokinase [Kaistella sp. SH40-3]MDP2458348.1 polysaccharide biosynthesis tyrosine autokinase [Kaistella sp. SH19-2b]
MELLENSEPLKRTKTVNIKKEIGKYLKKWPWFLLSLALFYGGAKIYLKYTQAQYNSKTSLKLRESKGNSSALSDLKNLGMGVSGDNELQGETTIIVSKPILESVAQNLNLGVTFFSIGKIKEVELYKDSPVSGKIVSIHQPDQFSGASYILEPVGKNSYKMAGSSNQYRFGTPAKLPFGTVQLNIKQGVQLTDQIKVVFQSLKATVAGLEGRLSVSLPENKGLLMDVSMVGPVPKKSEDILNEIANQYIIDGVNDKNQEAKNTKDFIDERLEVITEDLAGIEGQKEKFKQTNQITNLETQAGLAVSKADENTKVILTQSMQLDLVNSVLSASASEQLLPSGMGLPSGAESNIAEYNNLLLTRNRVLKQATGENPAVIEMNKQIAALKNLIRKNLVESRETLQLQIAQANAQLNLAKGNITKYPTQEKIFRSIDRQQTLKEQLYLYLLQKREENAITLAVTAPKAKIINPAYTTGIVQPNSKRIMNGALTAGFLLPLIFLIVWNSLDTKVHTKEHIMALMPVTAIVLAEIPLNPEENAVVHPNDFSTFAESFRILSSNLKYLLKAKKTTGGDVVLVTSSIKGEGKTTVSINTALTLAGKNKVIIIGADIRNPQLHRFVRGKNIGLTDYLMSDKTVPDSYIVPSKVNENLDVLFSGQIAPNPNDLLDMDKFTEMISYLKTKYDYIVLDSAPVMLVSDTLQLVEKSDVLLYVVRSEFTEKGMIDFAAGFQIENQIDNMAFVLNSVKPENTRYGKKYGYGYYSYTHELEKKWWERWF